MSNEDRRKITHDWKGLISSNLVTLIGAYLLFLSTQTNTHTGALTAAYAQIDTQGEQIIELRGLILQQQLQIVDLTVDLKDNVDRYEVLESTINILPFPVWIKRYDPPTDRFVMFLINDAYTAQYGITRAEYIGKTDFQVHPADFAASYVEADRAVLNTGKIDRRHQMLKRSDGSKIEIMVYKFPITLKDGRTGIGGVSIQRGDFDDI